MTPADVAQPVGFPLPVADNPVLLQGLLGVIERVGVPLLPVAEYLKPGVGDALAAGVVNALVEGEGLAEVGFGFGEIAQGRVGGAEVAVGVALPR